MEVNEILNVYLLIFLFSLFCVFSTRIEKAQNLAIPFCLCLVFILIASYRPCEMADYYNYKLFFSTKGNNRYEPAIKVIREISQLTLNPVFWGFAICAIISISLRIMAIAKFSKWFWGSIITYITYIFVLHDMITIRAGLASTFLPFVIYFKLEKKWICAIVCFLLSILCHQTAIVFVLVFLLKDNVKWKYLFPSFLVGAYLLALIGVQFGRFISLIGIEQVQDLFSSYSSSSANIYNLKQIGHILICIAGWYFWNKEQKVGDEDGKSMMLIMLKLYTIGLCFVPLLSDYLIIAFRFSEILLSIEVFIVPVVFCEIFSRDINKKLLLAFYSCIMFYFAYTDTGWWKQ